MRHLLLILCLLAALGPGPALAQEAMVVKLRDLNLASTAGAYVAIQRMNDAAYAFCASRGADGARSLDVTTLKCRRDMAWRAARLLKRANVSARLSGGDTRLFAVRD